MVTYTSFTLGILAIGNVFLFDPQVQFLILNSAGRAAAHQRTTPERRKSQNQKQ